MTALADSRPHVFDQVPTELDNDIDASSFGELIKWLLINHPDVDLPTIRISRHDVDGVTMLRVDARRGPLVDGEPGCPSCHVHGDQPHTEYCLLERCAAAPVTDDTGPICHHHPSACMHVYELDCIPKCTTKQAELESTVGRLG